MTILEEWHGDVLDGGEEGGVGAMAEAEGVAEGAVDGGRLGSMSGPARAEDAVEAHEWDAGGGGEGAEGEAELAAEVIW